MGFVGTVAVVLVELVEHLGAYRIHVDLDLLVERTGDDAGERDQHADHDELNQHERHRALVDLHGGHGLDHLVGDAVHIRLVGRDRAQEEQRKAERRVHERGLHVHRQQHAEPDQVDAHLFRHRAQQRHHDERELKVVQEEGQEEDHDVHHDQETHLSAGQAGQQMLDPLGAVGGLEHQAEGGGADHDEHDEAGEPGGGCQGLLEQRHVQALAHKAHDQRGHCSHGAAFGWRGDAQENGAQNKEDQQQRGDQHKRHTLGQLG
ncbi:hypothetical protein SDC9_140067 [bioreactor metagenome]|uniref:Uncharacterized protein n=1 Tax=bioreactor metagenome TaxID=1076179 RepID=A0A645DUC8_9ZZZZ